MALTGAYRIQVWGATARPRRGRHRLGSPGLRHCRHMRPVRARLVSRRVSRRGTNRITRHRAPSSPALMSATLMVALMVLSTVLVSGWYAAAGAAVIADIVRP
jgi:hypothetical protein